MRVPALVALFIGLATQVHGQPANTASVLVSTTMPHRGTVPEIVTAYGIATPAPNTATTLSLPRAGQVEALSVEAGTAVHAGGQLLTFHASPAAVLAYDQAVAALSLARQEKTHTAQLLSHQLATRSQLAQADKAVADAEANVAAQRRRGGGNAIQTVTAPFDGIVTTAYVKPGDRIAAGAPLLTLARSSGLAVSIGVEPDTWGKLHPGEAVKLTPLQDGGTSIDGTVRQVDAMLDLRTRKVGVVIGVASGVVLPNAGYRAEIVVGQLQGWPVPRDAVLTDSKGAYVFQVAGQKAHRVNVRIVGRFGETTVIDGPLDAKRPVVTQGNFQLTDGEAVRRSPAGQSSGGQSTGGQASSGTP